MTLQAKFVHRPSVSCDEVTQVVATQTKKHCPDAQLPFHAILVCEKGSDGVIVRRPLDLLEMEIEFPGPKFVSEVADLLLLGAYRIDVVSSSASFDWSASTMRG